MALHELRLSPWKPGNSFPHPRASHSVSLSNVNNEEYVYLLGGYSFNNGTTTFYDDVYFTKLTPEGNSDWTQTTGLPSGRSGSGSVIHNGRIYVVGGTDGTILDKVLYAKIADDHTVGDWTETSPLKVPRSNIGLQVVKTSNTVYYLAAIAGVTYSGQDYDALDSVEVALSTMTMALSASGLSVPIVSRTVGRHRLHLSKIRSCTYSGDLGHLWEVKPLYIKISNGRSLARTLALSPGNSIQAL